MPIIPMTTLLAIARIAAPIIFVGLAFWRYDAYRDNLCHKAVQEKVDEIELKSLRIKALEDEKNKSIDDAIQSHKRKIDQQHEENAKLLGQLSVSNHNLLAERLRNSRKTNCDGSHKPSDTNPGSAKSTYGAGLERAWMVSEGTGERLIERHELADNYMESLRACRAYISALQNEIK